MGVILTYNVMSDSSVGIGVAILGSRLGSLGRRQIPTSILGCMVYIRGA
jgi:hypothetical protein